jgi:SAM-dependent methyltransferase
MCQALGTANRKASRANDGGSPETYMSHVSEQLGWERHWHSTAGPSSLVGLIATLVRRQILSRAVRHYADRFFEPAGVFVECGCGTGQASQRMMRDGRRLVALDFALGALRQAARVPCFNDRLQADIRRLPFRDGSVTGIWNLGVLEHFEAGTAVEILSEFRRVLKPGGTVILFWPPEFGSSRWVLAPFEWLVSRKRGHKFRVFPDEVNRLRSKRQAAETLRAAGLEPASIDFTARDAFIHMVVVAKRPPA